MYLNGDRLPVKSFQEYVGLYISNKDAPRVYERVNDRWEVCVLASEGQFHQARALILSLPGLHALILQITPTALVLCGVGLVACMPCNVSLNRKL